MVIVVDSGTIYGVRRIMLHKCERYDGMCAAHTTSIFDDHVCQTRMTRFSFTIFAVVLLSGCASTGSSPAIVQPGAPGSTSTVFETAADLELKRPEHTPADTHFMQGMIHHHAQALEMAALVPTRTAREDVKLLAYRIDVSQESEIGLMKDWLKRRGEATETAHMHMAGMLSPGQMNELREAKGREFDRLFLTYMIQHHEGALSMVTDLFASKGAGLDQDIFRFATDVDSDQRMEITRMQNMLSNN